MYEKLFVGGERLGGDYTILEKCKLPWEYGLYHLLI
jgi:hypothetical protein